VNTAPKDQMTRRELLVRRVKRGEGLSWREVATSLGFGSIGGLMNVLGSDAPQDATLTRLRDWLARFGVNATLDDLAR